MKILTYEPTCPRCGCHDIRGYLWFYKCFKCGWIKPIKVDPEEIEKTYKDWKGGIK